MVVWMWVLGCSQHIEDTKVQEEEQVLDEMGEHWAEAEKMREAVIVADLDSFHRLAGEFAARLPVPGVPADLKHHEAALQAAVTTATTAPDLQAAGMAVGQMTAACGGCHLQARVRPQLPSQVHPTSGSDPELAMVWHHIAAARMWSALVRHEDEAFDAAATQLEKARFDLDAGTAPADALQALEDKVQAAAVSARTAPDRVAQGTKLGEILGTCAECHVAAGVDLQ